MSNENDRPGASRRDFFAAPAAAAAVTAAMLASKPLRADVPIPSIAIPKEIPANLTEAAEARVFRRPRNVGRRGIREALRRRKSGGDVLLPRQLHRHQRDGGGGRPRLWRPHRGRDVRRGRRLLARDRAKPPPAPAPKARASPT